MRNPLSVMILVALTGCGADLPLAKAGERAAASTTTTLPEPIETPDAHRAVGGDIQIFPCADVWRVGQRLPTSYPGCTHASGPQSMDATGETGVGWRCANGEFLVRGTAVERDGVMYRLSGRLGGEIRETTEAEFDAEASGCVDPEA